jgi:hypothetical protein
MSKPDWESIKVTGSQLLERVQAVVREGNVRQIAVKQGQRTVAVFPLTVGVVGALAAPILAAVGALAALLTDCSIEIERRAPAAPPAGTSKPESTKPSGKKSPSRSRSARS